MLYKHIRMLSEGSCDNEDWRKDAENSALHHMNNLKIYIYYNRKQLFKTVLYGDAVFTWMWNLSLMLLLMANVIGCKMPPKHISSRGRQRRSPNSSLVWHMRQYGHQKPQQPATWKQMPHISSHPQSQPPFIILSPPHTYRCPCLHSSHTLRCSTGSC